MRAEKESLWSTSFPTPPVPKGSGAALTSGITSCFQTSKWHLSYFSTLSISSPSSSHTFSASSLLQSANLNHLFSEKPAFSFLQGKKRARIFYAHEKPPPGWIGGKDCWTGISRRSGTSTLCSTVPLCLSLSLTWFLQKWMDIKKDLLGLLYNLHNSKWRKWALCPEIINNFKTVTAEQNQA